MSLHDHRLHAFRPDLADARLQGKVRADALRRRPAGARRRPACRAAQRAAARCRPVDAAADGRRCDSSSTKPTAGPGCRPSGTAMSAMPATRRSAARDARRDACRLRCRAHFYTRGRPEAAPGRENCRWARRSRWPGIAETRGTRYAFLASGEALVMRASAARWTSLPGISSPSPRRCSTRPICGAARPPSASTAPAWCSCRCAWPARSVLRDTDMQAATIGEPRRSGRRLFRPAARRPRLLEGHVAIMTDASTIDPRQRPHHDRVARGPVGSRRAHRLSLRRPDRVPAAIAIRQACAQQLLRIGRHVARSSSIPGAAIHHIGAAARRARTRPSARASGATRCSGSDVAAACGVTNTRGWLHSGLVCGSGSLSNTSRLASFSVPSSSARGCRRPSAAGRGRH